MNDRQGRDSPASLNATRRVFWVPPLSEEEAKERIESEQETPLWWFYLLIVLIAIACAGWHVLARM